MKLKEYRLKKGLTQKQMAAILDVTQGTISQLEQGKKSPGLRLAFTIHDKTDGNVPVNIWNSN